MLATIQAAVARGRRGSGGRANGAARRRGTQPWRADGRAGQQRRDPVAALPRPGRGRSADVRSVDASLARAFIRGCEAAFAAVAKPVEGTILTVARDVARGRSGRAQRRCGAGAACSRRPSVRRLPPSPAPRSCCPSCDRPVSSMRAGKGLELMLRGALGPAGEPLPADSRSLSDIALPTWTRSRPRVMGTRRCSSSCLARAAPGRGADPRPASISWANRCSSPATTVRSRVHIHNERPDRGLRLRPVLGSLSTINVENLDRQATDVRARGKGERGPIDPLRRRPALRRVRPSLRLRRARVGRACSAHSERLPSFRRPGCESVGR